MDFRLGLTTKLTTFPHAGMLHYLRCTSQRSLPLPTPPCLPRLRPRPRQHLHSQRFSGCDFGLLSLVCLSFATVEPEARSSTSCQLLPRHYASFTAPTPHIFLQLTHSSPSLHPSNGHRPQQAYSPSIQVLHCDMSGEVMDADLTIALDGIKNFHKTVIGRKTTIPTDLIQQDPK